jgi:hypothetical protein
MSELTKLKETLDEAMIRHIELDTLQDNIENDEAYRADVIEDLDNVESLITILNRKIDRIENA